MLHRHHRIPVKPVSKHAASVRARSSACLPQPQACSQQLMAAVAAAAKPQHHNCINHSNAAAALQQQQARSHLTATTPSPLCQVGGQQRAAADRPGRPAQPDCRLPRQPEALRVCDVGGRGAAEGVSLAHPQHLWCGCGCGWAQPIGCSSSSSSRPGGGCYCCSTGGSAAVDSCFAAATATCELACCTCCRRPCQACSSLSARARRCWRAAACRTPSCGRHA